MGVDESALETDVAALLAQFRAVPAPAIDEVDIAELRTAMSAAALPGAPAVRDVTSLSIELPGRRLHARLYRDGDEPAPLLVFFHGGGWVFGDLDGIDTVCRRFARGGFHVLSSTYRLAPEDPFPAARDDAVAVTRWAAEHVSSLGGDGRLAVGGESAGGNIAATAASVLAGELPIGLQVLLYPVVDDDLATISMDRFADGYVLTRDGMRWFWDSYLPEGDRRDPRVCLVGGDPARIPATIIATAGFDPLLDSNLRYVDHLEGGGALVEHLHFPGQLHGFAVTAPAVASCHDALERVVGRAAALLRGRVGLNST